MHKREGFAQQKGLSPTALAVTIAIHAAGLAAILLVRGDHILVDHGPEAITLIPIAPSPPPPPRNDDPVRKSGKTERPIDNPIPIDQGTIDHSGPIIVPIGPIGGDGTDGGTVIEPVRTDPLPVIVEATPDPRFARDFQPPYPPAMQRMGREGKVVVRVLVGGDGRVKAAEIVSSDDPAFSTVTQRQALSRWRFRPGTRDGAAVESWKTLTVRFEMKG